MTGASVDAVEDGGGGIREGPWDAGKDVWGHGNGPGEAKPCAARAPHAAALDVRLHQGASVWLVTSARTLAIARAPVVRQAMPLCFMRSASRCALVPSWVPRPRAAEGTRSGGTWKRQSTPASGVPSWPVTSVRARCACAPENAEQAEQAERASTVARVVREPLVATTSGAGAGEGSEGSASTARGGLVAGAHRPIQGGACRSAPATRGVPRQMEPVPLAYSLGEVRQRGVDPMRAISTNRDYRHPAHIVGACQRQSVRSTASQKGTDGGGAFASARAKP